MAKILITGGSGLVGSAISELLLKQGHEPRWLSREKGTAGRIQKFKWDLSTNYIDPAAFDGVEAVIHLAGAGIIDKRWTNSYKKEISDSRVKSSALLFDSLSKNNYKIKTLVGASAVGYYGSAESEHTYTETDSAGNDFLSEVCKIWEKSYTPFLEAGIRTSIIRTGIVLSKNGGAYAKMVPPFKFGLGAALGSGRQYFPWIHMDDLVGIFVHTLFNEKTHGPYNAASTEPVTNKQFSQSLAKSLHKPFFLPNVPAFALNLVLGESAVTVTRGVKISNEKIKKSGYRFQYDALEKALENLK